MVACWLRVRSARITCRLPSLRLEPHIPTRFRYPLSVAQVTRGLSRRWLHPSRGTVLARVLDHLIVVSVLSGQTGCALVSSVVFGRKITRGTGRAPGRHLVSFLSRITHGTLDFRGRPVPGVGGARKNRICGRQ